MPDDLLEPRPYADAGCPNNLGWGGNVYTDDPQYGIYAESLDAAPDITAKRGIFIAVLGDVGGEVKGPAFSAAAPSPPLSSRRPRSWATA